MTKKILHITTWYPNDTDPQLGVFIKKHISKGHDFAQNVVIAIIASSKVREPKVKIQNNGELTELIGYYPAFAGKRWSNFKNYRYIQTKLLQEFLKLNFSPDIITCHVGYKGLSFANKFFKGIPTFLVEHWSGFLNGNFQKLSGFQKKKRIKESNAVEKIAVVSNHLAEAMQQVGISNSIVVIPNVVEYENTKTLFNPDLKFLVVADLVDEIKDISGIIESFEHYLTKHSNSSLTIIGDGIDRELLIDSTNSDSINFLGRKENAEVLGLLPQHDCLIINSDHETFSLITCESLCSGVPVISSKCGGPEQFIQNEVNGLLFSKSSKNNLLNALLHFTENIQKFDSQEIATTARRKFSSNQISQDFQKLYNLKI